MFKVPDLKILTIELRKRVEMETVAYKYHKTINQLKKEYK
jgi:hypothetical protein